MMNVKEAVKAATEFFIGIMNGTASGVTLEEVDTRGNTWLITLSAWVPENRPPMTPIQSQLAPSLSDLFRPEVVKIYRIFEVESSTGEVKAMRIRTVQ